MSPAALVGRIEHRTHFRTRRTTTPPTTRTTVRAALAVLIIATTGCGTSADPQTWAEAEESGNVEANFMMACRLANEALPENNLAADRVEELCQCSFDGLRSELDFDDFKELDAALRITPDPNSLDDDKGETAEASWNHTVKRVIQSCTRRI